MGEYLLIEIKRKEDLISLFASNPTAPLWYYKGKKYHHYFNPSEGEHKIVWIKSEKPLGSLIYPKLYEPKEVLTVDINRLATITMDKFVELIQE